MTPTDLETLRGLAKRAREEIKGGPVRIYWVEIEALSALLAEYERIQAENEQKTQALLTVMRNGTLRATLKGGKQDG